MEPMSDHVRDIMLAAFRAARHGLSPDPLLAQAVVTGDKKFAIDQLKFDSLAWMEFCISVELQSGQELTPVDVEEMRYIFEIEEWLRGRI
jgi:hypothetical protein